MYEEPAIIFENVSKSYKIYKNKPSTLKEKIVNSILSKNPVEIIEFPTLKDASFTIYKGETIGIIGRNGAGKSTALKLIAKIISPEDGKIEVKGSVSSLLEIGAGFQPDLTGRENVYLYGSILGLSKKYIDLNYDKIVEFSELENFMDTAVKNYSSGMYMRLAFSVAIHVDPDILLVDEVLAVGDANFQRKCFMKIKEFQKQGKTIVFVSHDMSSVRELCTRAIFIEDGGGVFIDETDRVVNRYFFKIYGANHETGNSNYEINADNETITDISTFKEHVSIVDELNSIWGNKEILVTRAYFSNTDGTVNNVFSARMDIVLNVELQAKKIQEKVVIGFAVYDENGVHLSGPNSKKDGLVIESISGSKNIKIIMKQPPFLQGTYYVTLAVYDYACQNPFIVLDKYFVFHIVNEREEYGKVGINCDWIL